MSALPARPCLALPFTVLRAPGQVRLVAGEDFRFTLAGPGIESWLPEWLPTLDGRRSLDEALALLREEHRDAGRQLLERLVGERVVVSGPVEFAHPALSCALALEGESAVRRALEWLGVGGEGGPALAVLCQDRLDLDEALRFNSRLLPSGLPWMWVSTAALSRGYVSPVFLPDAGPCLACLFTGFRRLSPLPELYDELVGHARNGGVIAPSPFPAGGTAVLASLARWKATEWLARHEPPSALYRLHVLEAATLEVTSHRVLLDPECSACRGRR